MSDPSSIEQMFDVLAGKYDLFSDLLSFGLIRGWRKKALKGLRPGMEVLDLGCGSGRLTLMAAKVLAGSGRVTGIDLSSQMLDIARSHLKRNIGSHLSQIDFCKDSADNFLKDRRQTYDFIVSAFMLRSLGDSMDKTLRLMAFALKDGGRIALLEMVEPEAIWMRRIWKFHMSTNALFFGKIIFGNKYPDNFLLESAAAIRKPTALAESLTRLGFQSVKVRRFLFGNVCLFEAQR